MILSTLS